MKKATFEWDEEKDAENQAKHGFHFLWRKKLFLIPAVSSRKTQTIALKKICIIAWGVSVRVS